MQLTSRTLDNGLRVITIPFPAMESVTATIWAGVGSKFEDLKIGGISHFLEHMVFKGSKKRPSARDISEAVDSMGGEFNAGTSKEWTNFYIKGRSAKLETSLDILSDMVLNPLLKPEEIEREKGVILEEMAMYEDTPMYKISDVFEGLIFDKTMLGPDVIGTRESVKAITKDDFVQYRKMHYYAENMLLTIAGGVDEEKVYNLAKKYLEQDLPSKTHKRKGEQILISQNTPKFKLVSKKNEQAHFILGFIGSPKQHPERYIEAVLSTILGGGMSSRLFIEVRERRGLAYSVRSDVEHYVGTGYVGTYAGVETSKVEDAIKVVLEQHYGLADGTLAISDAELNKAKEYLKGHMALFLEDTKHVSRFFGEDELLLGKSDTLEDIYVGIDAVTKEEVVNVAKKLFTPDRLNLAIIGPYKSEEKFVKLLH